MLDFQKELDKYLCTPVTVFYVDYEDAFLTSYTEPVSEEYSPGKIETTLFSDRERKIYSSDIPEYTVETVALKDIPENILINYSIIYPEKICVRDPELKIESYNLPVIKAWGKENRENLLAECFSGVRFSTLTEMEYF